MTFLHVHNLKVCLAQNVYLNSSNIEHRPKHFSGTKSSTIVYLSQSYKTMKAHLKRPLGFST